MLKKQIIWIASAFGLLSLFALYIGITSEGKISEFSVSIFTTFLSLSIGLFLVNVFIDQKSRKVAAAPLARLVSLPIMSFHNDFIKWGREKFGTADFNRILDIYSENNGDPIALSPDQRSRMSQIIVENKDLINDHFRLIDERMSDLINVLGWSFDAKIISAALNCKQNIAEFYENLDAVSDAESLTRIEMLFDTDSSSGALLEYLFSVLGQSLPIGSR